jgi:acetylornithine deacetylase/succinyl-diaminopimelate desuccinylase-like protein
MSCRGASVCTGGERSARSLDWKARNSCHNTAMLHCRRSTFLGALLTLWALSALRVASASDAGLDRFRATYKELVETNTTLSSGDCTLAARRMEARLRATGYPDADLRIFVPEGHPKEGGLLAVLHGTDARAKAVLMLAHIDVVEAKREDWTRDPFILIEEAGYFYGRGTSDMKAQAAIWVDNLVRFREEGFKPKRSIKLALTCGEETNGAVNGADWLVHNAREEIDAAFAITEGMDAELDAQGHRVAMHVLAGEKVSQNFTFEATNPGGHSSRPRPDNAIYELMRALDRVSRFEFPVQLNDANRSYLVGMSKLQPGDKGAAMAALARDPTNAAALAILDQDVNLHAMLRTTCVATMLSAGHATNALPQRARANINCRIFPGVARETVLAQLTKIADDPQLSITIPEIRGPLAQATPLTQQIMGPLEMISHDLWPGVPVVPGLEPGASDAQFLNPAGIPTYGITGMFADPDNGNIHGVNERAHIQSVYESRTFLYRLVKAYATQ